MRLRMFDRRNGFNEAGAKKPRNSAIPEFGRVLLQASMRPGRRSPGILIGIGEQMAPTIRLQ